MKYTHKKGPKWKNSTIDTKKFIERLRFEERAHRLTSRDNEAMHSNLVNAYLSEDPTIARLEIIYLEDSIRFHLSNPEKDFPSKTAFKKAEKFRINNIQKVFDIATGAYNEFYRLDAKRIDEAARTFIEITKDYEKVLNEKEKAIFDLYEQGTLGNKNPAQKTLINERKKFAEYLKNGEHWLNKAEYILLQSAIAKIEKEIKKSLGYLYGTEIGSSIKHSVS